MFSPTSGNSLIELMEHLELQTGPSSLPTLTHPPSSKSKPLQRNLRSQKVIARSEEDGFYYPGLVLKHTDGRHVVVRFVDGQQASVLRKFVIPIGGAAPCPILQVSDHVLVQVRTRNGPHPSKGGSCDYFIPGTVQVLPESSRKGHALHTILVFNGRTVTCPRRGVVKISESLYKSVCKFIRIKMSDSHSEIKQESEQVEYASDFSDERATHTSNSQTSIKSHSPTHSSPRRSESDSAVEHNSKEDIDNGKKPAVGEAEIQSLLENQQTQGELLEQYQRDLASLQMRQSQVEEQLQRKEEERMDKEKHEVFEDTDGRNRQDSHSRLISQPVTEDGREMSAVPVNGNADINVVVIEQCEQAVNTEPWVEEKATETDPMTESRGVGTEWSESSSESDGETLDGFPSSQNTPSLSPIHASTPSPSTPGHTTTTHEGTPSHHHITTPMDSPTHQPNSTPTFDVPEDKKDLSSIAQQLVELGVDAFVGREVLAQWPDDGWYYRSKVVCPVGQHRYQVMDACDDVETIHVSNIVTDTQDAETPLQVNAR